MLKDTEMNFREVYRLLSGPVQNTHTHTHTCKCGRMLTLVELFLNFILFFVFEIFHIHR